MYQLAHWNQGKRNQDKKVEITVFLLLQKLPKAYLPHKRISLRPPTPLENSHFSFILSFKLLGLKSYLVIAWPAGLCRIRHTTTNQKSLAWRLYHVCFLEPVLSKSRTWSFIIFIQLSVFLFLLRYHATKEPKKTYTQGNTILQREGQQDKIQA